MTAIRKVELHVSVINVDAQLRTRHFDHLIAELDRMAPDTRFVVASVK